MQHSPKAVKWTVSLFLLHYKYPSWNSNTETWFGCSSTKHHEKNSPASSSSLYIVGNSLVTSFHFFISHHAFPGLQQLNGLSLARTIASLHRFCSSWMGSSANHHVACLIWGGEGVGKSPEEGGWGGEIKKGKLSSHCSLTDLRQLPAACLPPDLFSPLLVTTPALHVPCCCGGITQGEKKIKED